MGWITDFNNIDESGLYFRTYSPSIYLKQYVAYYWILKCSEPAPREAELMLPDGYEEIIFSYGGCYRREPVLNHQPVTKLKGSYLIGAKNTSVICSRYTTLNMVGVKLRPQTLSTLGKYSASSAFNQTLYISDLSGSRLTELENKIFETKSEQALISQLNQGLESILQGINFDPIVSFSINQMYRFLGKIPISDITEKASCHYRTLEKKFKHSVGMTPKQYARNLRFNAAFMDSKNNAERFNIEDHGYYDPSHFTKEFRFFTGLTPRQFAQSRTDLSTQVFEYSHSSARELESNAA